MSGKSAEDPRAPITKQQVKLLHQISKLKQLMNDAVYVLVKEVNSRETPAYQEEIEEESSIL